MKGLLPFIFMASKKNRVRSGFLRIIPFKLKAGIAVAFTVLALAGGDRFLSGRVIEVADGDSLTVYSSPGQKIRVRLYGVDSPESGQAGGEEAGAFCRSLALYRQVKVKVLSGDQYGRSVAVLTLPDGRVLNEEMVRHGHAWVYTRYCKESDCRGWKRLENEARSKKQGLWKRPNPQPPWQWRKKHGRRR